MKHKRTRQPQYGDDGESFSRRRRLRTPLIITGGSGAIMLVAVSWNLIRPQLQDDLDLERDQVVIGVLVLLFAIYLILRAFERLRKRYSEAKGAMRVQEHSE